MRPSIFLKKLFRPFEAVPWGTRKQTGLPRETLLDRGPLLSGPQGQMASPLDDGRTPALLRWGVSDNLVKLGNTLTKRLIGVWIRSTVAVRDPTLESGGLQ